MNEVYYPPYPSIPKLIKLNLGCGHDYREGYVNVDKYPTTRMDGLCDLESFPWPWETNSVEEVVLRHVLEHLGQATDVYKQIIQELYRVCAPGAIVHIEVPHPFHPDYIGDPTHCRPVTAQGLWLLSVDFCRDILHQGYPSSTLAMYWDVDFPMLENIEYVDPNRDNILKWSKMTLRVRKPIKLCIDGPGIGDVCMGLATAHALYEAGYRVSIVAQPNFYSLIQACPFIDQITNNRDEERYLSSAWYHMQAAHEVDTFCRACGVIDAPAETKSLVVTVPEEVTQQMQEKYPTDGNYVLIHPAGRVLARHWPDHYWQELVNKFQADGIKVIATGMLDWLGDTTLKLDGVTNEFDLPPLHTIALMNQCKLFIAADTGPVQLAAATDVAILGLYSTILPEQRLPYRHGELGWNATGLVVACPEAGCYRKMVTDNPDGFFWSDLASDIYTKSSIGSMIHNWCLMEENKHGCMASISVNQVYEEAIKLYKKNI